jgi:hypothetical protein
MRTPMSSIVILENQPNKIIARDFGGYDYLERLEEIFMASLRKERLIAEVVAERGTPLAHPEILVARNPKFNFTQDTLEITGIAPFKGLIEQAFWLLYTQHRVSIVGARGSYDILHS